MNKEPVKVCREFSTKEYKFVKRKTNVRVEKKKLSSEGIGYFFVLAEMYFLEGISENRAEE